MHDKAIFWSSQGENTTALINIFVLYLYQLHPVIISEVMVIWIHGKEMETFLGS